MNLGSGFIRPLLFILCYNISGLRVDDLTHFLQSLTYPFLLTLSSSSNDIFGIICFIGITNITST